MSSTMDVLKPELIWIQGRCYRVNDPTSEVTTLQEHDLYENELPLNDNGDYDEGDDDDFEIDQIDDTRFRTSFHVSKHYFGSIIGKKGATRARLEHDTKTQINIPRIGKSGDIVITGPSAASVKTARRRINLLVISSRMRQAPTHFISIPINSPEILKNFETFKESVISECPDKGIDETIFIAGPKLHLTVGVMCLMDTEERQAATKLLNDAKENIILPLLRPHMPLKLRLKGLSYMRDDPKKVNVLYGNVQEEDAPPGTVQKLADDLLNYFYNEGFMPKEYGRDDVKLHVTLINSRYRTQSDTSAEEPEDPDESKPGRNWPKRESFDASGIMEKFGDFDFGVAEVTTVTLSLMHKDPGPDGYYQSTCIVSLLEN